ncbi:hypothetical protein B0T25DRAFT_554321 [Lasiosphaeria hispida]|uniref:Secreted protein n=1 Tax=Lasiosphaeria hispida TaxID=260671 RepID=A0AAJ0H7W8_9PEZI|nr:hypothetical protein B0T25DRAFT_554321 [Lasiosphaeria hispida]
MHLALLTGWCLICRAVATDQPVSFLRGYFLPGQTAYGLVIYCLALPSFVHVEKRLNAASPPHLLSLWNVLVCNL